MLAAPAANAWNDFGLAAGMLGGLFWMCGLRFGFLVLFLGFWDDFNDFVLFS